jgi:cysteine desulfurase
MINEKQIYFDYNSTTPIDERVLDSLLTASSNYFGNSGSKHNLGHLSDKLVLEARTKLASLINCSSNEIIFTSGATESINLGIQGFVKRNSGRGNHVITVATEHKVVLETYKELEKIGFEVSILHVDSEGNINLDELKRTLSNKTILVSIMLVNNETGVIHPIKEIAEIVHNGGAYLLTDATQAVGKIDVDVQELGVDLLAFSGHKFYSPKGIGALYIRTGLSVSPILYGGAQEGNLRSGTLNVPSIIAFGRACEIAKLEMKKIENNVKILRDLLEKELLQIDGSYINGNLKSRIFNVTNICFPGQDARVIIGRLRDISVSNGSACNSLIDQPSHVLTAMGVCNDDAFASIRFSLGKYNTIAEVNYVAERIKEITSKIICDA